MSAYDKSVDAVIFKHEDETSKGVPMGPVWIRRGGVQIAYEVLCLGDPEWFTLTRARSLAKKLRLPIFEV